MEDKEKEHICEEDVCELNETDVQKHTNLCCCAMDEADTYEDPCCSADENECCC